MVKRYQLILTTIFLIVFISLTSPAMAFKDFRGKVIDADTEEPIEGAVVVAIWTREVIRLYWVGIVKYPRWLGAEEEIFKEARETVTDKNGEFSIKPYHHYSLRPLSKLWLRWVIFKPGYASFAPGSYPRHPKVRPKGISPNGITSKIFCPYTVVELPKLKTRKERRKYLIRPPRHPVPVEKILLLIQAINVERVKLGLKPYNIEGLKTSYKAREEELRRGTEMWKEFKKELKKLRRNRRYIKVNIVSPQDGAIVDTDSLDVVVNFRPKGHRSANVWSLTLKLNGEKPITYKYKKTLVYRYSKPVTEGTYTFKLNITDLPDGEHTLQAFSYPESMPRGYLETPSVMVTFIKEDIER